MKKTKARIEVGVQNMFKIMKFGVKIELIQVYSLKLEI